MKNTRFKLYLTLAFAVGMFCYQLADRGNNNESAGTDNTTAAPDVANPDHAAHHLAASDQTPTDKRAKETATTGTAAAESAATGTDSGVADSDGSNHPTGGDTRDAQPGEPREPARLKPFLLRGAASSETVNDYAVLDLDMKAVSTLHRTRRNRVMAVELVLDPYTSVEAEVISRDIYTEHARTVVMTDDGPVDVERPNLNFYIGTIAGDNDSWAEFTVSEDYLIGTAQYEGKQFRFGPIEDPNAGGNADHMAFNMADMNTYDWGDREFCTMGAEVVDQYLPAESGDDGSGTASGENPPPSSGFETYDQVELAIDGDHDLYTQFSSNAASVFSYYAASINTINTIYQRDVDVDLKINYQNVWTTAGGSYPYTGTTTSTLLSQVRTYWNANQGAVSRDVVHLYSGHNNIGGRAYLNALCNSSIAYGVSGVYGTTNTATSNGMWDIVVVAHELGHNHGSGHTHCYNPAIDRCYNECYSTGPCVQGTIMSYCHLCGGMFNISLNFHTRVSDTMKSFVNSVNCLSEITTGPDMSFGAFALQSSVGLRWTDPQDELMPNSTVYIRRSTNGYPATSGDGTEVYTGTAQTFEDTDLTPGQIYYYRIWVNDGSPYADAATNYQISATPDSGQAKLLFRHAGDSRFNVKILATDGSVKGESAKQSTNAAWLTKDVADIDSNGYDDILMRHQSDGRFQVKFLDKFGVLSDAATKPYINSSWIIKKVSDVDGDSIPDLLMRHISDGRFQVKFVNADGTLTEPETKPYINKNWLIKDVSDVNGDGRGDLLMRHVSDGRFQVKFVNANGTLNDPASKPYINKAWIIKKVSDVNGDGRADLLMRHVSDGRFQVKFVNANGTLSDPGSKPYINKNWIIKEVSDVNGDGRADLLMRHASDGRFQVKFVNANGTLSDAAEKPAINASWVIIKVDDVDGDTRGDLIMRHVSDGRFQVKFVNADGTLSEPGEKPSVNSQWLIKATID